VRRRARIAQHLAVPGEGFALSVLDSGGLLQQLGEGLVDLLALAGREGFGAIQDVPGLRQLLQRGDATGERGGARRRLAGPRSGPAGAPGRRKLA
jgi:hypothetical protein